jgi:hypothetical protein
VENKSSLALFILKTPGWEQWSFGTPNPLGDYLYGASKDSLKDSNG